MSVEHDLPIIFLIDTDVDGMEAIDDDGVVDEEETIRLKDIITRFRAR